MVVNIQKCNEYFHVIAVKTIIKEYEIRLMKEDNLIITKHVFKVEPKNVKKRQNQEKHNHLVKSDYQF